jgi:hypothetical protein
MKVKLVKGKVQIPAGYYRLDKRQRVRNGDLVVSANTDRSNWEHSGRAGCFADLFNLIYIRKLSKKQTRKVVEEPLKQNVEYVGTIGRPRIPIGWAVVPRNQKCRTGDLYCWSRKHHTTDGKDIWEATGVPGKLQATQLLYIRRVKSKRIRNS